MKIINFCYGITSKQIKYCLNELPSIYRTCEVPILFVNRNYIGYLIFRYYARKYNINDKNYKEFKEVGGTSYYNIDNHEPIFIFCSKGKSNTSKEFLIFTLFHELRHWYQQKHLKNFHIKYSEIYNNNVTLIGYEKQALEKDANNFSKKYCLKLGVKFIKVKGIDYIKNKSNLRTKKGS